MEPQSRTPLGRASSEWFDNDARYGSVALLIEQLRYGQHSLGREAFWTTVAALRAKGHKL